MKKKAYITPLVETIEIFDKSCPLCGSTTQHYMDFGNRFSAGEQYSQKKEQESIWDGMSDE